MTAKLIVYCPEHMAAVREVADRTGRRQQFESRLSILTDYLTDKWTVELYIEIDIPYSFYWVDYSPQGGRGLTGDLTYHGSHSRNGSVTTYLGNLTPTNAWRIHL
jgi:hypothetical protein